MISANKVLMLVPHDDAVPQRNEVGHVQRHPIR